MQIIFSAHSWDMWLAGVCINALQSVQLCPWWQWDSSAWRADPSQPGLQSLTSVYLLFTFPACPPDDTIQGHWHRSHGTVPKPERSLCAPVTCCASWTHSYASCQHLPKSTSVGTHQPCGGDPGGRLISGQTDRQTWRRMNSLEDMEPLTDLFVASLATSLPAHLAVAPSVSTVKSVQMRKNGPRLDWSVVQKRNAPMIRLETNTQE